MGSGLHTAFILTCLWELSERDTDPAGIVFGLEEPENDLHPHAQRQLYDTLGDLVNQGYQVVLSTHSAHLVSGEEIFDVRRVEKQNNRSQIHTAEEQNFSQDQAESIQRRMTAENNEMFFSKVLLLGEGQTEEWILPIFNSLLDSKREKQYAFDRLGVTLISTDGKSGMKPFLRIADCYNIPAVALIDNDEDVDDGHSGIRKEIDDMATVTQELPDDAEAELFNSVSLAEFQDVMSSAVPEYKNTTEDLEQWRDGADISEFEVMREDFDDHSPSKPLFGKILAEQMTESQLPENFVDLMDTTRNIALGKGIEDN
jgi:predicted ATP-dependent endonuclease of OLD family